MYCGFPRLALILVVSAAPKEKIVEGVGDETNQELVANTTDPIRGADPLHSPGTYLGVEVSAHGLLSPRLEVELSSALFLWVTHHIGHGLREMARDRERRTHLFPSFTPLWINLRPPKRCHNPNPPGPMNVTLFGNSVSEMVKLR